MISAIVAVGSIGTSFALIDHAEPVDIAGDLRVIDGNIKAIRSDGAPSALGVTNTGGSAGFQFNDVDDAQVFKFVLANDGSHFLFMDVTDNRKDITIRLDTGNVGIGENNPQEKLDIGGNLHVRDGIITSDGDICIGTCP